METFKAEEQTLLR